MRNKKSQTEISSTLLWIAVSFLLLIIIFLYLVGVSFLIGKNPFSVGERYIEVSENKKNDFGVINSFFYFLESPIEWKGEKMKVKELVKDYENNNEKYYEFVGLSEDFLRKNILKKENSKINAGEVEKAFIKIFDYNELVIYIASYDERIQKLLNECNFFDKNSNLFYYLTPNNKVIFLCIQYKK